ncbi:hypothetical protein BJ875DRAFT_491684 [Amylocarpus encephaloides]|uniref:Uncharacterized protein n=1 Tax=Amylocarpus encephaloides TaxID=45428 RepID=A0A9P7YTF6_9HELO|nr:hypothetical protein BJ875DRAFT_491684 [Amylocarpus encephaloides]
MFSSVMEQVLDLVFMMDHVDQIKEPVTPTLEDHSTQTEEVEPNHIMVNEHTPHAEEDDFAQFMQTCERMEAQMCNMNVFPFQIQPARLPLLQQQDLVDSEIQLASEIAGSLRIAAFEFEKWLTAQDGGSKPTEALQAPLSELTRAEEIWPQLPQPQEPIYSDENTAKEMVSKDRELNSACNPCQYIAATRPVLLDMIAVRQWHQNWNTQRHFSAPDGMNLMAQGMQLQQQMLNSNDYGCQENPVARPTQSHFAAQPQLWMMPPQTQQQGPAQLHQRPLMRGPQAPVHRQAWSYLPRGQMNQQYPAGPQPQQPTQWPSTHPGDQCQQLRLQPIEDPERPSWRGVFVGEEIKGIYLKPGEEVPSKLKPYNFDPPLCTSEFEKNNGRAPASSKREGAIKRKAASKAMKDAMVLKKKRRKLTTGPSPRSAATCS